MDIDFERIPKLSDGDILVVKGAEMTIDSLMAIKEHMGADVALLNLPDGSDIYKIDKDKIVAWLDEHTDWRDDD